MSKLRTDSAGTLVERGDIVASFPRGGGMEIARVNNVFESGRVTGKVSHGRNVYAYEHGAPQVERAGKKFSHYDTHPTMKDWRGHPRQIPVYVDYTYMVDDYTVVGHKHYWVNKQLADIGMLVLIKHDGTKVLDLMAEVNRDWDAEAPQ